MASIYQESQREKAIDLIQSKNPVFYGSLGGKKFMTKFRDFVLIDNIKNLFEPIRSDAVEYFKKNKISWWGGKQPTGHSLSSQIACINHLYQIRNDKEAVLTILKNISDDFTDVLPVVNDKFKPAYIQFEAVSDNDNLNEGVPNRGSNCTSIDALIFGVRNDGSHWLIPIEWKYTEFYNNQNKATEGCTKETKGSKGETRKNRYSQLINNSSQLRSENHFCYYFEPFYQLMRQTLWAEQMIINSKNETLKATNFLHVHVIPSENSDLLEKKYKCSGMGMEATWRFHLEDQSKYFIITPEKLMNGIKDKTYYDLLQYLKIRYW
ncbi:hypothetical protein EW093_00840 [Thiospirochaeta perfilievii]|uniref:Restriction endonuclease n=1 Tax=Thiospirochaeta perfilievii TaxID=252967 RepID=A0A5C1Q8L9_9SPIO|nr:hypothetical protein [Thiospirochaeta perfilievii]QEN03309.1 hypothetical protein EW093_00840 [Thiospirochaeta perfilievii]